MEIAIVALGILLILIGFAGSVLPALPGPPISYIALLLLFFHDKGSAAMAANNYTWLIGLGIVTIVILIADYYMPIWGTKKYGGTKAGTRGSTIGLIVGLLLTIFTAGFGALTILLAPLLGAYLGEKYTGQSEKVAIQSAKGSFLGFLAGTFMKVVIVVAIAIYFAAALI